MKPVYLDGPLRGQRFDTDNSFISYPDELSPGKSEPLDYQLKKIGFWFGNPRKAAFLWIGWCGPEPDAEDICRALLRDDVLARAEFVALPPDPTA